MCVKIVLWGSGSVAVLSMSLVSGCAPQINGPVEPSPALLSETGQAKVKQSMAHKWFKLMKAEPGVTTELQFSKQMGDGLKPQREWIGNKFFLTWIFDDDSQIIASFQYKNAQGSTRELVLYTVNFPVTPLKGRAYSPTPRSLGSTSRN